MLESRGQASSAGFKHSKAQQPLTNWSTEDRHHQQSSKTARHSSHSPTGEQRTGIISRLGTQKGTAATHKLEGRGQTSSAVLKHSKAQQPLTNWRVEDRHHQEASNTARHSSHSQTGEQKTGIISRLQTQQGTATTHRLESRGQASSAGLKHSKAQQPLTCWRAEDRHHQQA